MAATHITIRGFDIDWVEDLLIEQESELLPGAKWGEGENSDTLYIDILEMSREHRYGTPRYNQVLNDFKNEMKAYEALSVISDKVNALDDIFVEILQESHSLVTNTIEVVSSVGWGLYQIAQEQRRGRGTLVPRTEEYRANSKRHLIDTAKLVVAYGYGGTSEPTSF